MQIPIVRRGFLSWAYCTLVPLVSRRILHDGSIGAWWSSSVEEESVSKDVPATRVRNPCPQGRAVTSVWGVGRPSACLPVQREIMGDPPLVILEEHWLLLLGLLLRRWGFEYKSDGLVRFQGNPRVEHCRARKQTTDRGDGRIQGTWLGTNQIRSRRKSCDSCRRSPERLLSSGRSPSEGPRAGKRWMATCTPHVSEQVAIRVHRIVKACCEINRLGRAAKHWTDT